MHITRESGGVGLTCAEGERELILVFAAQLNETLVSGMHGDPARELLFPSAYPDDPVEAEQFSRYTHDALVATKRAAALEVIKALLAVRNIDSDNENVDINNMVVNIGTNIWQWLTFLTDVRRVLSQRIADAEGGDESLQEAFDWFGILHEGILAASDDSVSDAS
ncbi:MAG: hypothetical protein B5766_13155 [Candidatus Lumbricidophila eiseniae]|uniref:Uncharacterized protein n=1 Tax=Candidatus Lumbricidiphila eiseniae TaxID=1969409 RepID=A0A2A6FMI7_9MICO|nr:MAG: hypothetical protein B5766_13155 [Candidatus Lumbricidophila eiseniae]